MDYQVARHYILSQPDAIEDFPFGPEISVFKIKGKMFATLGLKAKAGESSSTANINLKCDPEEALMLRDIFESVIPGYHMNKRHWNTVILDTSIPPGEIERMIDNSFKLVVSKMTKKDQASIKMKIKI